MNELLEASVPLKAVNYRRDIDGIRALAILSVVGFHVGLSVFHGGYVGVDVFFVISGYLIATLIYKDISRGSFSIVYFYQRRAKRILPALFGVLFFSFFSALALLSPLELKDFCAEAVSSVLSCSNVYYWLRSDYFTSGAQFKALLMTWSLGIEEQFYLTFPIILLLLYKYARPVLLKIVILLAVLSFVCSAIWAHLHPSAGFYLLPSRAWELALGVAMAIYQAQHVRSANADERIFDNVLGWAGLTLIVSSVVFYSEGTSFPGIAAILPTVGTACLILSPESFVNRRCLSSRPMVFVGLVSYSWYLWHWPLFSFARIVTGGQVSTTVGMLAATLSLCIAVLSYRFIEQPFRASTRPAGSLLVRYCALIMLFAIAPLVGYVQQGWPSRTPDLQVADSAVREMKRNVCLAGYGVAVPQLSAPCVVNGSGDKIALLGDSHAASLGNALEHFSIRKGYGFEQLTKASCPPLSTVTRRIASHPQHDMECAEFNRAALNYVLNDSSIKTVVLAGYWSAPSTGSKAQDYYWDTAHPKKEVSEAESFMYLRSGLLQTIDLLKSSGKRVFVATDVPRFDFDPVGIVRNSKMKWRGSLARLLAPSSLSLAPVVQRTVFKPADITAERIVRQAATDGGAKILDLSLNLCRESQCRFWSDGILFYADSQHLTTAGAEFALQGQDFLGKRSEMFSNYQQRLDLSANIAAAKNQRIHPL